MAGCFLELEVSSNERVVPAVLLVIPNSDFDLRLVVRCVNVFWESENHIARLLGHESCWIWERDVPKSLFNGQNVPHNPLVGIPARFWVGIHLEVDNTTNDNVILDLGRSQVIVACPEASQHKRLCGLLVG